MANSGEEGIEAVRERWPVLFNAGKMDELGDWFYAEDARALPPTPHRSRAAPRSSSSSGSSTSPGT
jgi:hypothetical protein